MIGSSGALPIRLRSAVILTLVSVIGLSMFVWPLAADQDSQLAHNTDAPFAFAAVLAMLVLVLATEVTAGQLDAKALAMLGVLSATAAALRPLGAGMSGFQPMFVILVLGGRALGPGFGFSLGLVSMFGSALLTGGVGPWLPFQMLGAAWLGMGAGLLPRAAGKAETVLLVAYGAVSGLLYGFLLNMWFWPFLTTTDSAIAFVPGDAVTANLARFLAFCLITSLGFDIPRALGTAVLLVAMGPPTLRAIRRSTARANFQASPRFVPARADGG